MFFLLVLTFIYIQEHTHTHGYPHIVCVFCQTCHHHHTSVSEVEQNHKMATLGLPWISTKPHFISAIKDRTYHKSVHQKNKNRRGKKKRKVVDNSKTERLTWLVWKHCVASAAVDQIFSLPEQTGVEEELYIKRTSVPNLQICLWPH